MTNQKREQTFKEAIRESIQERDQEKLEITIYHARCVFNEDQISEMVQEVLKESPSEDFEWWINTLPEETQEEMNSQAQTVIHEVLKDSNFELGKDYSFLPDGGIALSNDAQEYLLSTIPSGEDREKLRKELNRQNNIPKNHV